MQMTQEQKNEFTTHFMINMVADKGKKKAQDEAIQKQQEQTKLNLRKSEIWLEKDKKKKSAHTQRYMENLLKLLYALITSENFSGSHKCFTLWLDGSKTHRACTQYLLYRGQGQHEVSGRQKWRSEGTLGNLKLIKVILQIEG